jgi:hypothetical protein
MESSPIDWSSLLNDPLGLLVAAAAVLLLLLLILIVVGMMLVRRFFGRPDETVIPPPVDLGIDLDQLIQDGPADPKLHAEVYGTPVRVAVIVLAPVGRDGVMPEMVEFFDIVNQLVPGFGEVVQRDRPLIRAWSGQLSSQGFASSFFNSIPLPGDRGKGSPWCSIAGKFTANKQHYLAGIVFRGQTDNVLSQYTIQHEGQWIDILRVKRLAT